MLSNSFDTEFRALVKEAREVFEIKFGNVISSGNSNPLMISLNRYMKIYEKTKPEEHFELFVRIYEKNREMILGTIKNNDNWIFKGPVILQYGEGTNLEAKCKDIRINITEVYRACKELEDKANEIAKELGAEAVPDGRNLIRREIVLLHLMRIFYHLIDTKDRGEIGRIVNNLEDNLGMSKKTHAAPNPEATGDTGGFSSLFEMASGFLEGAGLQRPPGVKPPTEGEVMGIMKQVLGNPQTQGIVKNMTNAFANTKPNPDNMGETFNEVLKNIATPENVENIKESTEAAIKEKEEKKEE